MKAYVLESVGNIVCKDVDMPEIPEGWVLVKVMASGICSSDIPRIFKNGTYHFPTIPGHEFSGVVSEVSSNGDKSLVGKRCAVFPLIPCRICEQCKNGQYQRCSDYDYVGSRRDGAFAEYVVVPEWSIFEIPNGISFEEASMTEPIAVAMHAVKKADVKGKKTAVIGTGIIAFSAALIARKMGADVTIIARNDEKRYLAERLNLDYSTDCDDKSDVVLECVGSNDSLIESIKRVNAGGTIILVGNPYGNMSLDKDIYWSLLRKEITVKGVWNSGYEQFGESDWKDVIRMMSKGVPFKELITHTFRKDALIDALEMMRDRKESYCKVVIKW